MTEEPGSDRWNWLAEGNAKQARKRVAVELIFWKEGNEILLVDPNYKDGWDIPGGMVEANESPLAAVRREIREELGIDAEVGELLTVEWAPPRGPWDDLLTLTFDGGNLDTSTIKSITLLDGELSRFAFVSPHVLSEYLPPRVNARASRALGQYVTKQESYDEIREPY